MTIKSANLLKPPTVRQVGSAKKPSTPNSLYSGIPSAQRAIQQQRYVGSASGRRSVQLKRDHEDTNAIATENRVSTLHYHPWESKCSKIITREKSIKAMTKDSYTPMTRLISHAVERVTTDTECLPTLIPAKAVKIETFNIKQAPRRSVAPIVRYLRRNELMPSERPTPSPTPINVSLLSQSEYKKLTISVTNTSKITGVAPTLATTDRLLTRAKMRNDPPIIRRPPRRLVMNISRQTNMPLSVYG